MASLPIFKKITLIILAISFGSILISGFFINYALNRQFQDYLTQSELARRQQILRVLADLYQEAGGWERLPERIGFGRGMFFGNLRYVTDNSGQVVLIVRRGPTPLKQASANPLPITIGARRVGTAYFGRTILQDILSRQDELFRKTINSSIFWSILITGFISLGVAFIFAKRLSNPITEINQIARNMANGNLETRVSKLPRDELGELGESINHLAEQLQHVEELRKKMTADVAHDLRTPLTTVRSHLEGMIDQVIPSSAGNLESVLEEVNRLISLVNDLQAIAIADNPAHQLIKKPVEIKEFIHELVKRMNPLFHQKGVILEVGEVPKIVLQTNRDALAKIFDNLLSNALKFTSSGKKVSLSVNHGLSRVEFKVADEGIGIGRDDLPFIFERFYRTDHSRNRESGGFGLGLTIVKELVQMLGGTIEVSSAIGLGTSFTIKFPFYNSP